MHSLSLVIQTFSHPITRDYSALPNTDGLQQGALKKGHQLAHGAFVQPALQIINKGCIMIIAMQQGEQATFQSMLPWLRSCRAAGWEQWVALIHTVPRDRRTLPTQESEHSLHSPEFSRLPGVCLHLSSMHALHFVYLYFQKLNR